jgi:lysophospholipase L1-like esterase
MRIFLIACCLLLILPLTYSQDPTRFAAEIEQFGPRPDLKAPIVFTGSSSIRMWTGLEEAFPEAMVLNRGFGGSHFSDLIVYVNECVLQYQPKQVFIYEGDNDINAGETPKAILKEAKQLVKLLQKQLPGVDIVLIAPKPSLARWKWADQYVDLNSRLEKWAGRKKGVRFVDVWSVMLTEEGNPMPDIFIEDDLHLNEKGYAIWTEAIRPFLSKKQK